MEATINLAIFLFFCFCLLYILSIFNEICVSDHLKKFISISSFMIQISHKINRLAFGDYFPGMLNPLDG